MNLAEGAVSYIELTIPDGTKISNVLELEDGIYPVGLSHPIVTTSTAVIFNTKDDEASTLVPFNENGAALSVTIDNTIAAYEALLPSQFVGLKWIQLAVADNQTGDKVFQLAVRGV